VNAGVKVRRVQLPKAALAFGLSARASRARSSRLIRAKAMPNSSSALAMAGSTTLVRRSDPACDTSASSTVPRRAQNIVGRHVPSIACKLVAAARAADALQYSVAHQRLQHGFKMPRWQAVARGECFCGNRVALRLYCHVDNCSNREDSFAGEQRHAGENVASRKIIRSDGAILRRAFGPVELRFSRACRQYSSRFQSSQIRQRFARSNLDLRIQQVLHVISARLLAAQSAFRD
jgi:hypothetical protein